MTVIVGDDQLSSSSAAAAAAASALRPADVGGFNRRETTSQQPANSASQPSTADRYQPLIGEQLIGGRGQSLYRGRDDVTTERLRRHRHRRRQLV